MKTYLFVPFALLAGCAGGDETDTTGTTQQAECSAEVTRGAGPDGMGFPCPWEQQFYNIKKNGNVVAGNPFIVSGTATTTVKVSRSCGHWLMARDPNDVIVFIDTNNGEVLTHGAFHVGYPTSELPLTLALPISY